MFIHRFLETTPLFATVLKHVYIWNWNSYEAASGLILEVINCTLTWNSKQEIDGQREVVPFLRSYHICLPTPRVQFPLQILAERDTTLERDDGLSMAMCRSGVCTALKVAQR